MNSILAKTISLVLLFGFTFGCAHKDSASFENEMDNYLSTPSGQEKLTNAFQSYGENKQKETEKIEEAKLLAKIEEQLKNPIEVDVNGSPSKGAKSAKITIVEFSDFQCRFCKKGDRLIKDLMSEYPNDIKLVFKNLPLSMHREARKAAKAALAAGKQGKFWEMHDALFEEQARLGDRLYMSEAARLNLDLEKFSRDMNSKEIENQIRRDEMVARRHGIKGTPEFLVSGVPVLGAMPVSHFKLIVDRILRAEVKQAVAY